MRNIQAKTRAQIRSGVVPLATCWYVRVADRFVGFSSQIFRLTDHDMAIEVSDETTPHKIQLSGTYLASTAFRRLAVKSEADLEIGSCEISGVSHDTLGRFRTQLRSSDLRAGVFDGADTTLFLVDVEDPTEITILMRGRISGVNVTRDGSFSLQIEDWTHLLQQRVNILTQAECRADLGDGDCQVPITSPTWFKSGRVTAIESQTIAGVEDPSYPFQVFRVSITTDRPEENEADWFSLGMIYWRSGANAGFTSEVSDGDRNRIRLVYPAAYEIRVGDTFQIYPGCDKRFIGSCRDKFNNQANFRGEPLLPGTDVVSQVGNPNRSPAYTGIAGAVPDFDVESMPEGDDTIPPGRDDAGPGSTAPPNDGRNGADGGP